MHLPRPRGPISEAVVEVVRGGRAEIPSVTDIRSEDAQIALWTVYELAYRGFGDASPDAERDLELLRWRHHAEDLLEAELRDLTRAAVDEARAAAATVEGRLRALVDAGPSTPLARHLQRRATREQVLAYLVERSVYHLKESDPQAFVLGRVDGPAKVALGELLYDEYGGGRPERLHSHLYAEALEACGLDATYGAYIDQVEAPTLLSNNVMSLFAMQRRLRGASLGHLAAFEATSTDPCRRIAVGIERVGLPDAAAAYFHEHVEADAVHEQVVMGDICGAAVAAEPAIEDDLLLGAATCLIIDAEASQALYDAITAPAPELAGAGR
ncbi:iron-containing redox enzyme family protein [Nocardioides sp. ChNu-153]|uniref:iron-containing redox enzyme family protein n=1 Tax=unclassified Nocardioides TaxID=2615069 RepID=UPI002406B0F9|nr:MULTISPECIES: iron-containing redox enzyme family protein [unclassified Nocardioides]MDF9717497.1 iron-containing redox enzyme family protein [Nocardioides sp. ChNu-99]MDN7122092.1 iron-containing redox enzyme family protein [Nocardioides sp. ChNu-153]